jgi:hypothetical protein
VDAMRDAIIGIRVREIRIGEFDLPGVLVELSGELDVCDLEPLRRTLDNTLDSGLSTYVDLSGVTFLDVVMHPGVGGSVPSVQHLRPPLGVTPPFLPG